MPQASQYLSFEITGPGRIAGVGSGDPHCHEPDKAAARSAFHGRARVIVQSNGKGSGPIELRASARGLADGFAKIGIGVSRMGGTSATQQQGGPGRGRTTSGIFASRGSSIRKHVSLADAGKALSMSDVVLESEPP